MDERETGGEGMGGWAVGGTEGSSWMGGKWMGGKEGGWVGGKRESWMGRKRESKGRIEVRLPLLKALDNARNRLSGKGNSAKDGTLTCV